MFIEVLRKERLEFYFFLEDDFLVEIGKYSIELAELILCEPVEIAYLDKTVLESALHVRVENRKLAEILYLRFSLLYGQYCVEEHAVVFYAFFIAY